VSPAVALPADEHRCVVGQARARAVLRVAPSSSLIRTANTGDNCNAPKDECSIVRSSWSPPYLTCFLRSDCDLQCATPACSTRFRYLDEGRIFQFEGHRFQCPGISARSTNCQSRRRKYFWLFDSCALTMTLVAEPDTRVALVPALGAVDKSIAPGWWRKSRAKGAN
jgi:hypothetical protein